MAHLTPIIVYVPHGGGPLPLLGDPGHADLTAYLTSLGKELPRPGAILVVSAHFEGPVATVTAAANPKMLYDYYGFPSEAYALEYPAPGSPALALKIKGCLKAAGIPVSVDEHRGFDHGTFVPLMLMYPDADIPVVQLSLVGSLDPKSHIDIGKALAFLECEDLLIVGSGMSFHNMAAFGRATVSNKEKAQRFHDWLRATLVDLNLDTSDREQRLIEWQDAPEARFAHPREEHLLPLHVCFGIALARSTEANILMDEAVLGYSSLCVQWQ